MDAWTLELTVGDLLLDISILGALLLLGTVLRRQVRFFQRYMVPNSLIAGFMGLFLGSELFNVLPLDPERMGAYVYHLLAVTFIGIGLYPTSSRHTTGAVHLGFMQVSIMLIQGIVGVGIALAATWLVLPDLNPAMGLLLPLGFAMGPGIAYSVGQSWSAFGYEDGGNAGLSIAAIGFLVAYFLGMYLINGTRAHAADPALLDSGFLPATDRPVGSRLSFSGAAIEPLAVHVALVGGIYCLTYLLVSSLAVLLTLAGLSQEIPVLWSFHFILANLMAVGMRRLVLRGWAGDWIDEGMVRRMTGTFADYLITASIVGISLSVSWDFVAPILAISAGGTLATYLFLKLVVRRVFGAHVLERFIAMFAQMTGTISSGLALLRVTDPEYRTPVAEELVLASGMALGMGFPLLLAINMPFSLFDGSTPGFLILSGVLLVYLAVLLVCWNRFARTNPGTHTPE
ncbi:MAG: sodium:glutamate symporter [Bacteroidetes bacterium CG12_big_fil_rev_8_21_14_0_65_60_17]|nr:MAG: sodium:glutamate symporter [Bacteroidetes bacterium CG12_big_fil_rev_8_21_14_0_65_60_17]